MIPAQFDYTRPGSLDEAVRALADGGEDAKVIAGGQSLLPLLRLRLSFPDMLVDVGGLGELRGVRDEGETLWIGALTTIDEAQHDPVLAQHCGLLAQTAALIARGPGGERAIGAGDFFLDYLTTALAPSEILTGIRVPKLGPGWGYRYEKFNLTAQAWAIVGVAALARRANGHVAEARIGLTNMGLVPVRAQAAEQAVAGAEASTQALRAAAERADEGTQPPSDLHGGSDYRRHLARVLTARALDRKSVV